MGANKRMFMDEREINNNNYKNKKTMAHGTGNDDSNRTVFFAKMKGLKKEYTDNPWIGLEQKKGDEYIEVEKSQWISGWMSSAKIGSYEYEGKNVKTFEIILEDGITKYIFQSSYNNLSGSLRNT